MKCGNKKKKNFEIGRVSRRNKDVDKKEGKDGIEILETGESEEGMTIGSAIVNDFIDYSYDVIKSNKIIEKNAEDKDIDIKDIENKDMHAVDEKKNDKIIDDKNNNSTENDKMNLRRERVEPYLGNQKFFFMNIKSTTIPNLQSMVEQLKSGIDSPGPGSLLIITAQKPMSSVISLLKRKRACDNTTSVSSWSPLLENQLVQAYEQFNYTYMTTNTF